MVNNAHFILASGGAAPQLIVRDDRGTPVTELVLPSTVTDTSQADKHLRDAGWTRSSDTKWTEGDDGWVAPVVPA